MKLISPTLRIFVWMAVMIWNCWLWLAESMFGVREWVQEAEEDRWQAVGDDDSVMTRRRA